MAWQWRTLDRDKWNEASELLDIVAARYPVLVARPAKPLAIGTGDRLKTMRAEVGLTEEQADLVLVRVTRTSSYLAALARGGPRYDLEGEIAGEVSEAERKAAGAVLAARRARRRARIDADNACRSAETDQANDACECSVEAADATEVRGAEAGKADDPVDAGGATQAGAVSDAGGSDDRAAA
jgi:ProQ/FINO family.